MTCRQHSHFHLWYVFSGLTLIRDKNFKNKLINIPPLLIADTQKIHLHLQHALIIICYGRKSVNVIFPHTISILLRL